LLALPFGFLLDQLLGDPPSWPHPVRWLGRLIQFLEPPLRRGLPERLAGILLLVLVTGVAGGTALAALHLAGLWHPGARLALAGPVGLWVFKAVSTLDSTVGYRNPRYLRFGWASARADDLANLVPARLTWLLLAPAALLTGDRAGAALRVGWRDGRKHPSPN